jgi:hypothetical protein
MVETALRRRLPRALVHRAGQPHNYLAAGPREAADLSGYPLESMQAIDSPAENKLADAASHVCSDVELQGRAPPVVRNTRA